MGYIFTWVLITIVRYVVFTRQKGINQSALYGTDLIPFCISDKPLKYLLTF